MSDEKKQGTSVSSTLGTLVIMGAGAWYYFGGGMERHVEHESERIGDMVARDAVKQYEIAKRSGSPMDACVNAGMMAAAYLQAQDEAGYQRAKAVEKADCEKAGLPQ
ncbi:MAG TPA: hypothetical protein VI299_03870 [Polyangiales bacterium]